MRIHIAAALLLASLGARGASIYKCQAPDGTFVYQQAACSPRRNPSPSA